MALNPASRNALPEDRPLSTPQTLGVQLLAQSVISPPALARAEAAAAANGARLEAMILRLGLVEETVLLPLLCAHYQTPRADLSTLTLDRPAITRLTPAYLAAHQAVPLLTAEGTPVLLLADPGNDDLAREIAFLLGGPRPLQGATASEIRSLLASAAAADEGASQPAPTPGTTAPISAEPPNTALTPREAALLRADATEGPVIKYVQDILSDAVSAGASDIHIEMRAEGLMLRFRLNGILQPQPPGPALDPSGVIARLKVMAGVNVAEKRLPQDGRLSAMIGGRNVDFRFSSLPTSWGESLVLRILDPKALRLGWDKLGFDPHLTEQICALIERPHGLFLVTGPTGSGKTTTLYTALAHLNRPGRKLITVEDPVEYDLPGVQQVQVQDEIGLTFARVLRSVLRHDPNIILIGEIRDEETAAIAARAAQVGRMVLSTLHTRSAGAALTRLVDLGVPKYLARDVLCGVLGQELIIPPCSACQGRGCPQCKGTGTGPRHLRAELWQSGAA